ncbi:MAG: ATP phosphoribosyltransferase [Candidatus Palauibacterales bacterium]|nr:ATP phosphoribosyltransferase [Candidatus Palauibacterales bacterium]MDP2530445.1 ATP phosphoribosyltransferase [Candidatus Palauibacterales bacterium]MDP2584629.1 ATP phosphoribosyltransferase [Candidatus Palauibacterales bacterium]
MRITNGHNLRIAVQNDGRLTSRSLELLRGIGLEFEEHERRLFARCRNADVELLFIRDDDIPEYVHDGVADLGIVGRNVVIEQGSRVEELESLGFGFCTLALAVPREDAARTPRDLDGRRIATTHPAALRHYLDREGIDARVVEIRGAAEVAPALDVADAICDLVSTGTTLRMNDLRRLGDVFESEAVLVANPATLLDRERAALVERLRVRLRGLLVARHMKYVTLNAPRCALPRIQEILPGMKSPTVVPLAEEGMVALHAAVEEEVFWEVMERIKEAGGSEILVLPVEKVMR